MLREDHPLNLERFNQRRCSKCGVFKALEDFYVCAGVIQSRCKKCHCKHVSSNQRNKKQKVARLEKEIEKEKEYQRRYYATHKNEYKVYRETFKAKHPDYYKNYLATRREQNAKLRHDTEKEMKNENGKVKK